MDNRPGHGPPEHGHPEQPSLHHRRGVLDLRTPAVMAIINVTPDSFSDGGRFSSAEDAVDACLQALDDGAAVLDLGAESTRPGALPVSDDVQLERLLPVLRRLRARTDAVVSIDTTSAAVARGCLEEGADVINDISGLTFDPALARVVAEAGAGLVVMHTPGRPHEMDRLVDPEADIVAAVRRALGESVARATSAGVDRARLMVDPGFGFGKDLRQNVELARDLAQLGSLGLPVLAGVSRKRMVRALAGAHARSPGGIEQANTALHVALLARGAAMLRVHDVGAAMVAVAVHEALTAGRLPAAASPAVS